MMNLNLIFAAKTCSLATTHVLQLVMLESIGGSRGGARPP